MRVMVIVKANNDSEAGGVPDEAMLTEMGRYNEELVKAGIMQDGEGLHPTLKGVRVRLGGGTKSVVNGPFTPVGEQMAGFWLWKVASMDEAIDWAKRCPNPSGGDFDLEIRPIMEMEDFGDALTPEVRAQDRGFATSSPRNPDSLLRARRILHGRQYAKHAAIDDVGRGIVDAFVERLVVHRMKDGDSLQRLVDSERFQTFVQSRALHPFVVTSAADVEQMKEHRLHRRRRDLIRFGAMPRHYLGDRHRRTAARERRRVERQIVHAKLAAGHRDRAAERAGMGDVEEEKGVVEVQLDVGGNVALCDVTDHGHVDANDVPLGRKRRPIGLHEDVAVRAVAKGGRSLTKEIDSVRYPRLTCNLGGKIVFVHGRHLRRQNGTASSCDRTFVDRITPFRGAASARDIGSPCFVYDSWKSPEVFEAATSTMAAANVQ